MVQSAKEKQENETAPVPAPLYPVVQVTQRHSDQEDLNWQALKVITLEEKRTRTGDVSEACEVFFCSLQDVCHAGLEDECHAGLEDECHADLGSDCSVVSAGTFCCVSIIRRVNPHC